MERLTQLDLLQTTLGDRSAAALARIPNLEWLDLSDTKITETGLRFLEQSNSLKEMQLSGTALTHAQIEAARIRRPDLKIFATRAEEIADGLGTESEP